jgi:phage gpG-like protein
MSDSVTVRVVKLEDHFAAALAAASGTTLAKAVMAGGQVVETHARINASRGRPGLNEVSGHLVASINTVLVKSTDTSAEADVGPTNIPYGRIHEFGGVIKALTSRGLRFMINGQWITKQVVHIPARPYLRPAADENMDRITDAVGYELKAALQKAAP